MSALIRAHDWEATPLGAIQQWPQSLRSSLSICLRSRTATAICWGPEYLFFYNDAWAGFLGERHPAALGRPAREVMADIWPVLEGQFRTVSENAETVNVYDALLVRNLGGVSFDSYWTYSLLPVASEDGTIGGILSQAHDSSQTVLRARRDALMLRMSERLRLLREPGEVIETAVALVAEEIAAPRIGYAEVDDDGETLTILHCRVDEGVADICGTYPLMGAGEEVHRDLSAGRTSRINDVAAEDWMTPEQREAYCLAGIVSSLTVPVISGDRYRAMLFAHHSKPHPWSAAEEALLLEATELVWREVTRARAESARRGSEERYRRVFEQANDIIVTATLDQVITDVNPAAAEAIELPREEVIGRTMRDFLTPQSWEQARGKLFEKLAEGGTTKHELDVVARSGRLLHWEINSTLTLDRAGKPIGLHAIARDVTERRRAEERQRLLVNELNHRVKNTLALVQGLALQSFREGRDPAAAKSAFQHRLAALASAHDLLTRESWEGATLGGVARAALGHLGAQERRIALEGPEVKLGPKAAVSLAMALHELCTNAAKYGALSQSEGRVRLDWQVDGDRLRIAWREHGGPPVSPPGRSGFGLRMIDRALAADLGGHVEMDFADDGLVCRIEASLAEAAPQGQAA
ncbi:MAG TPA: HWE histidine kinase domain-containing protein [Allosphingosinicella sp.]|nr:HWE histidine kinase domain-containing protein [Allosphingosinicella sp.]